MSVPIPENEQSNVCVSYIDSASGYGFGILIWNFVESVLFYFMSYTYWRRRGRDRVVGGFITICATSFEFETHSW